MQKKNKNNAPARGGGGGGERRLIALSAAMSAVGLLTACGGGGTNNTPGTGPDSAYFSGKNDSMATRISNAGSLEEATTFKAKTVGLDHIWGEEHALAESEDITIQIYRTSADAVPTFVVTYNDETTTFGPEHAPDNENYEIEGDQERLLWTQDGYPLDLASGFDWGDWTEDDSYNPQRRKYHVPVGLYYDGDPTNLRRFAVIGLETAPGDMPTHGVRALYEGRVRMDVYPTNADSRDRYSADITLIADFSKNTVDGVMDDWEYRSSDESLPGVSYTVAAATISGNGFTTSMAPSPTCTGCMEVVGSTVAGKFYGPYADETGGTIQGSFRDGDEELVGIGVFYTSRD